ncbi:molybdenum cofactor biosynthesis protein B [Cyanobacterium aponinum AL20118]|uniref:Molybdenum cofactor biosynthesis protein B n=1 Tax=Cyanobacterium aponinum AL20115 TaxID=3090662 RepID=A0AAF1C532_9CHRO|nr:molybdenum cofactor biosynthesis protein B [Cyanobacterium aponinum]WPF88045.1 molybdenum cofactor biosynthesis protein B [Cyanobacterium aponinum AL20115]
MSIPHPDKMFISVNCAIITVSDSRTVVNDESGQIIQELLIKSGHKIVNYIIIKDNKELIEIALKNIAKNDNLHCLIFNGGTGISNRDHTYDVLANLLDKTLSGFGEIFRFLSYQEIGSRAIASRALAGVYQGKLVFSLPGSTGAVKLGLEKLILPELNHLWTQINN